MRCPKCDSEQKGTKFCTSCGARLPEEDINEQKAEETAVEAAGAPDEVEIEAAGAPDEAEIEAAGAADEAESKELPKARESTAAPIPSQELAADRSNDDEDNITLSTEETGQSLVTQPNKGLLLWLPFVSGAVLTAMICLAAAGITYGFTSQMQIDMVYHLLANVASLPAEQAAFFSNDLKLGFWNSLLAMHGGSYLGQYFTGEQLEAEWSFAFPVLALQLLTIGLLCLIFYVMNQFWLSKRDIRLLHKLYFVLAGGVTYGFLTAAVLYITHPESVFVFGTQEASLSLYTPIVKTACTSTAFYLIAGAVIFKPWPNLELRKATSFLPGIGRMAVLLLAFYLLISLLIVGTWSLSDRNSLYNEHLLTMGELWTQYADDPLIYLLLPNLVVQEQLYALGATWSVQGEWLPKLLHAAFSFQANLYTGVASGTPDLAGEMFAEQAKAMRGTLLAVWHPYALLLAFLYAVSAVRMKGWLALVLSITCVTGLFSFMAYHLAIRFTNSQGDAASVSETIGFSPLQTGGSVLMTAAVFLSVSYGLQLIIRKKQRGGVSEQ